MLTSNYKSLILFIGIYLNCMQALAVIEDCEQRVNFDNAQTYAQITGQINCYLKDNNQIKTRSVTLKNGKLHGKTTYYAAYQNSINKINNIKST